MRTASIKVIVTLATLALVVSCGDDDTTSNDPSNNTNNAKPPSNNTNPPSNNTKPPTPGLETIAAVASADKNFSMLVAAASRAGLVDTLSSAGPFTVFAPTNAAFEASGITDVNAVPIDQLKTILLYHVLSGKVEASAVKAGPVDSAAELTVFIGTASGVTLNGGNSVKGGANVIATDVQASNGVIHAIDRVILPPDIPTAAVYGGLSNLVAAVGAAANLPDGPSVLEALQGSGPFTVFAPTNDAFDAISAPSDPAALRDVLLYHVVASKVLSSGIPAAADSLLANRWGNPITLLFNTADGVKVNMANVAVADIKTTNGVVHVIDKVLLPPDIIDAAAIAGLSSLADAIGAASSLPGGTSILDALKADEPYTVFAPTDAAFADITAPADPAVLRDVLLLHVVMADAPVLSSALTPGPVPTLLSGEALTFDASAPSVSSGGTMSAMIGPLDVNVTNGVVHIIDKVLLPTQ